MVCGLAAGGRWIRTIGSASWRAHEVARRHRPARSPLALRAFIARHSALFANFLRRPPGPPLGGFPIPVLMSLVAAGPPHADRPRARAHARETHGRTLGEGLEGSKTGQSRSHRA